MMEVIENLNQIQQKIDEAKKRAGRTDHVEILGATKFVDYDLIDQAIEWGLKSIGENRTDEMIKRIDHYEDTDLDFHFIGYLQRNKIRDIVGKVDFIHSIGTKRLVKALSRRADFGGVNQDILLQVNISKEDTKNGIYLDDLQEFVYNILKYDNLRIRGLMTMAPYGADESELRHIFSSLYEANEKIKSKNYKEASMDYLSMGMSGDYEIAVEEGANIVRIGSGIFGKREY